MMQMRCRQHVDVILVLLVVITSPVWLSEKLAAMPGGVDFNKIEQQVAALALGFDGYHIANTLSDKQKEQARLTRLEKSYPGTYTFTDGDVFILVEEEGNTILAVYMKNEDADRTAMQQMIAGLMSRFGNPTSEAHDQIIYWAYDAGGRVSDEQYADFKKEGESTILATVKFKSKLSFAELDEELKGEEKSQKGDQVDGDGGGQQKNTIHCIVSAPRLLERFYQQ